ncbi:GNAT family N-acetyltransferase [Dietzia alimentaria]|uniref:GNAT family N-acetyltransferase n=1 Tax=Dietzia alimentaria TaxID=665550 RepID=UPI00029AEFB4|nr:GNAT family N-acetyltransferase [Dietzia alimentaria]
MTQSNSESTEPVVRDAPEKKRFEVVVGGDVAGFTQYVDHDEQRIFYHTEIGEQYAGRGLASTLIAFALAETRGAGQRIVPICPFVARYLEKHDDFADIADPVTPAAHRAVKNSTA